MLTIITTGRITAIAKVSMRTITRALKVNLRQDSTSVPAKHLGPTSVQSAAHDIGGAHDLSAHASFAAFPLLHWAPRFTVSRLQFGLLLHKVGPLRLAHVSSLIIYWLKLSLFFPALFTVRSVQDMFKSHLELQRVTWVKVATHSNIYIYNSINNMLLVYNSLNDGISTENDCCAFAPKLFGWISLIEFPETLELRIKGFFRARKNSCRTPSQSVAKHYGCKRARNCGLIENGRSQANRDLSLYEIFKNWFMLSVHLSRYWCTREVGRAREKGNASCNPSFTKELFMVFDQSAHAFHREYVIKTVVPLASLAAQQLCYSICGWRGGQMIDTHFCRCHGFGARSRVVQEGQFVQLVQLSLHAFDLIFQLGDQDFLALQAGNPR